MKKIVTQGVFQGVIIFILYPPVMGMGQSGYSSGSSGGGAFGAFLPILIGLIILMIPVIKAYNAAKEAEKFKTLVFINTFYENLGWILCFTIIGIPIGLGLVLIAQTSNVFIKIEANTNQILKFFGNQQENHE